MKQQMRNGRKLPMTTLNLPQVGLFAWLVQFDWEGMKAWIPVQTNEGNCGLLDKICHLEFIYLLNINISIYIGIIHQKGFRWTLEWFGSFGLSHLPHLVQLNHTRVCSSLMRWCWFAFRGNSGCCSLYWLVKKVCLGSSFRLLLGVLLEFSCLLILTNRIAV